MDGRLGRPRGRVRGRVNDRSCGSNNIGLATGRVNPWTRHESEGFGEKPRTGPGVHSGDGNPECERTRV